MRSHIRSLVFFSALLLLFFYFSSYHETTSSKLRQYFRKPNNSPIDKLISESHETWKNFTREATDSLSAGAKAYRKRRGRHPPPGFDTWYQYAESKDTIIIEEFFDQIYRDIEPYWGIEPEQLKSSVQAWPDVLQLRGGRIASLPSAPFRIDEWTKMIEAVANLLPDMNIPVNNLDEARILAPHHVVAEAMKRAGEQKQRMIDTPFDAFSGSTGDAGTSDYGEMGERIEWITGTHGLHTAIRDSCSPDSALGKMSLPWFTEENRAMGVVDEIKFVQNTSETKLICDDPALTHQHGDLVKPATVHFTTNLMPVFSGGKIPNYNDIVIPEPSYYTEDPRYTGKDEQGDWSTHYKWQEKEDRLGWRGKGTGGQPADETFIYYHRERFVSKMNASETMYELSSPRLPGTNTTEHAAWLQDTTDVKMTALFCGTSTNTEDCPEMMEHYTLGEHKRMGDQYLWKYLPDVDGNSVSERFRAFLLSSSTPIKATLFDDWHDHRLMAWKHYIPMHLSYNDLFDLMRYFIGYKPDRIPAHDKEGQRIADDGREWAEQVLRREDMVIYLHRALLEYARVVHENRDHLGWVEDLRS